MHTAFCTMHCTPRLCGVYWSHHLVESDTLPGGRGGQLAVIMKYELSVSYKICVNNMELKDQHLVLSGQKSQSFNKV